MVLKGKTHTMVGTPGNPGVMARAVADIFRLCQSGSTDYGTKAEVIYANINMCKMLFYGGKEKEESLYFS